MTIIDARPGCTVVLLGQDKSCEWKRWRRSVCSCKLERFSVRHGFSRLSWNCCVASSARFCHRFESCPPEGFGFGWRHRHAERVSASKFSPQINRSPTILNLRRATGEIRNSIDVRKISPIRWKFVDRHELWRVAHGALLFFRKQESVFPIMSLVRFPPKENIEAPLLI